MLNNNLAYVKYLLSSEQDVSWGMVVTTVGQQIIKPGMVYPSKNHPKCYQFSIDKGRTLNEYQLVYISSGSGNFKSSKLKNTKISEGMAFLLFPDEWHSYHPNPQTGWHESWIGFTGRDMQKRMEAGFFSPEKPLFNIGIQDDVISLFRRAITESEELHAGYQQMLGGIINMLLGFIYSRNRQTLFEDMRVTNYVNKAKILMQENVGQNIPCEKIAEMVNMGYSRFRRIFKDYTGFAPAQYMQELKINKSKELLTNTIISCKEIAYEVGFDSPSYFNIVFKKRTLMTPLEYRLFTQGHSI